MRTLLKQKPKHSANLDKLEVLKSFFPERRLYTQRDYKIDNQYKLSQLYIAAYFRRQCLWQQKSS